MMTPENAWSIVDGALAQLRVNRSDHMTLIQAMAILKPLPPPVGSEDQDKSSEKEL